MDIDDYVARFEAEPGYLDFARLGPVGRTVQEEIAAHTSLLAHARFGALEVLKSHDARVRGSVAALVGVPAEQISFQPNTSQGLMHAMFGLDGVVALSPADFPSLPFAAQRAHEALGRVAPRWLDTDHGRITPGNLRDQLTDDVTAVAVSLVDFRTGYLADLEGIRQVIGDRLLIVDAIQGFGVVDAPYEVADVVVSGGQKWVRAGWGTGFLALSARGVDRIRPVWSGYTATDADDMPLDEVLPPTRGAGAFAVTNPDPLAQVRFAAALDELATVGVRAVGERVALNVARLIDLADEFAIPVASPRAEHERAGIVVVEPDAEQVTIFAAALHNHGVTATVRDGRIRLSAHATTSEETFAMARAAFLSFSTALPA